MGVLSLSLRRDVYTVTQPTLPAVICSGFRIANALRCFAPRLGERRVPKSGSTRMKPSKRRSAPTPAQIAKVSAGVPGFDDVLGGGFPAGRLYLLEGDPGTGKTTLALQFLLEGARLGDRVAFITLSESRIELTASAESHGWSLDGIDIREYVATADALTPDGQVTMFRPSEVELIKTVRHVLRDIEAIKPDRVVVDSLSELRLLAQDSFRYRRQLLALKEFFLSRRCTVLLLDDR